MIVRNMTVFFYKSTGSPSSMFKLQNLSPDYLCYGKSAMEAAVSTGFIKGRPFGGTAILVRKALSKGVTSVLTFDRVVAPEICNFLFIVLSFNSSITCPAKMDQLIAILIT